MSESSRETLQDVREWSRDLPRCPGVVKRPSLISGRPSRMSGSSLEAFPDIRECSGGLPGCTGVVERPSPIVQEWSGGPPGYPREVGSYYQRPERIGRQSQKFGRGRKSLLDIREWSGGPPGCPGVVERPSQMSESGREAPSDVLEFRDVLPDILE